MLTSLEVMERIKAIIARRYRALTLSVLGKTSLTKNEVRELKARGVKVPEHPSLIEIAYYHNLLNPHGQEGGPASIEDARAQQAGTWPEDSAREYAKQHARESMKLSIEKLRQDVTSRILGLIQENNQNFKFSTMTSNQTEDVQKLIGQSTVGKLKQRLRDTSGDANRDWSRVAVTEVSNAIGIGSVDRILTQKNELKAPDEVYVYRIPVVDAALCKYCRRFYLDDDGSPKLYRLSTLLANGSNFGKKAADWLPVVGATHPNDRESAAIELKPGWKILPGGAQTYIGLDGWDEYLLNKIS